MTVAHPEPVSGPHFGEVYTRLVSGLGVVWIGGWLALLLYGRGDGVAALTVLIGSAMVGGQRAGARASGFVVLEVAALVALAIQVPLLMYAWADLGPLSLIAVAVIQVPFAVAATRFSRP